MLPNRLSPRRLASGLVLALALFWPSAAAKAELMRYEYSGVITSASPDAPSPVGTRFSGTFAYDPGEAPAPSAQQHGVNTQFGLVFGTGKPDSDELTVSVGGRSVYEQRGGLEVASFAGIGQGARGVNLGISSGNFADLPITNVALQFVGGDGRLYPLGMPPSAVHLGDFARAKLFVNSQNTSGFFSYQGTIDSLVAVPTPEPSTACLLVAASIALAWRRRRRS